MSSSFRPKRVADEIRRVISERIVRGLKDPLPGFVTIRDVEVNRDFTRATVFVSVYGTDAEKTEAIEVLKSQRGLLRREVGNKVRLRNTPDLAFELDESGERAARIHQLLDDVRPAPTDDEEEPGASTEGGATRAPGPDEESE